MAEEVSFSGGSTLQRIRLQVIDSSADLTKHSEITLFGKPSRGGLEVERWSDNRTDSASVGSNPV